MKTVNDALNPYRMMKKCFQSLKDTDKPQSKEEKREVLWKALGATGVPVLFLGILQAASVDIFYFIDHPSFWSLSAIFVSKASLITVILFLLAFMIFSSEKRREAQYRRHLNIQRMEEALSVIEDVS